MSTSARTNLVPVICVAAVLGLVAVLWFIFRTPPQPSGTAPTKGADSADQAFREGAVEAGINFHMRFLPGEQGEKFKINLYDHGCGLAVGDYDGDGHEDVYFCNQLGPNALYRNRGDGTFEDVTALAGVGLGDRICVAATFVDYDNDGRADLYVTSTRGGNVLFRNLGAGKFQDVTQQAGLKHVGHAQTAVFFDFDNDGRLDLFLTNTAQWTTDVIEKPGGYFVGKGADGLRSIIRSPKEFNLLYRNNGDGTFADVTEKAGLKGLGWAGDAVAFDYDEDGYSDLFVGNMFGRCQLNRNNRDGTFTDVTLKVLGRTPYGAVGATVFDAHNDGHLDLYVVDMHSDMWIEPSPGSLEQAREVEHKKFRYATGPATETSPARVEAEMADAQLLGYRHDEVLFGNAFFKNAGGGKFTEVSDQIQLETFWPWGIATGDFDNDGHEDAFVPAGMGYPYFYWGNSLMMNKGDGTFRDRASELGIEPPRRGINLPEKLGDKLAPRSSRCAVTGDFDGDGRLDILANNFNDLPYYFRNQFPRKNFLALRLQGTHSNRDAIGAIVRVHQGERIFTRQVRAACGYLSHSSRTIHIGLGDQPKIDRVEITWPSGVRQQVDGIVANKRHDIMEPAK